MTNPRMMFYQDGRHPLIYTYEPPIQKEEYEAAIDEILGTPIDTLVFCLGEGRTMLHDTKVGELWGHNVDKWPHDIWRRAHQNAKHLIEEGNDPLKIICERSRSEGILIYPSLNVQWEDSPERGEGTVWVRVSDFRFNNKHLEIGAKGGINPEFRGYKALDFKHKAVREERFAIIKETVDRYPIDGFEINLNNCPYYFHPDEVEDGINIMTEWIEQVYETVKKSGSNRKLAIRVANSIERCKSVGLDIQEWINQGIVDVLVSQDQNYRPNHMANFHPLVKSAENTPCLIFAAIQNMVSDPAPLHSEPIEMTRASACNYWDQGIDGLFLDRGWFADWPYGSSFYEKLRELPHPNLMAQKDKSYHILTGDGRTAGLEFSAKLPALLEEGNPTDIQFVISDDLPRWDKVGRVHSVLLRIGVIGCSELDNIEFKLNGKKLPESNMRTINMMFRMRVPLNRSVSGYWFIFKPDRDNWPIQGKNTLEVTLLKRDPDLTSSVSVKHVELETKYLMGKNYYHGRVDPDLGSYNYTQDNP